MITSSTTTPAADEAERERPHRPLLITGAHRSGTGWVAKVLAVSPTPLGYIWEPFNPTRRPGTFSPGFPRYYEYVCAENATPPVTRSVAELLAFDYHPLAELRSLRSVKDAARMARDWSRFERYRRRGATALVKDPIALFSSEWLAERFSMDVAVLIRHPAAFAASIKRRNWRHDFRSFLAQPLLMRDFLAPFEEQVRAHAARPQEIVEEAILLWNILYTAVERFQERRPEWTYVRLEDLSRRPLEEFRALFDRLGIAWGDRVEALVLETSSTSNPTVESHGGSVRRHSEAHSWSWRNQLSGEEIARIRAGTAELAGRFYGEEDWAGSG